MFPVTRIYESEDAANAVVERLVAGEVARRNIIVIHASDPAALDQVDAAIERGAAMGGYRRPLKDALGNGRSIVNVKPDFGQGSFVEVTMSRGAVDADTMPDYSPSYPAPLSDLLCIPTLTEGKSSTRLSTVSPTTSFGFKTLSSKAAPLSSLFGLKLLSSKSGSIAEGTAVERMSGKPAPFSSIFGLKLISSKKSGSIAEGSSVERMSDNPAPFSSFFGLRVLSKRD